MLKTVGDKDPRTLGPSAIDTVWQCISSRVTLLAAWKIWGGEEDRVMQRIADVEALREIRVRFNVRLVP